MTTLEALTIGWLLVSVGTFLFLGLLVIQSLRNGGLEAFRRIDVGFPTIVLVLVGLSLCWPWGLMKICTLVGRRP